jgi:hypothetical protein
MRLRRTTKHENKLMFSEASTSQEGHSVIQASVVGDCLKVGSTYVMTQIPPIRLTRAGKGTTFCRTRKREGRMTPDLCTAFEELKKL